MRMETLLSAIRAFYLWQKFKKSVSAHSPEAFCPGALFDLAAVALFCRPSVASLRASKEGSFLLRMLAAEIGTKRRMLRRSGMSLLGGIVLQNSSGFCG
jgi:hypothetical protein